MERNTRQRIEELLTLLHRFEAMRPVPEQRGIVAVAIAAIEEELRTLSHLLASRPQRCVPATAGA